jgi:phosphodiesterase/alkaline phosphatase D-like protein
MYILVRATTLVITVAIIATVVFIHLALGDGMGQFGPVCGAVTTNSAVISIGLREFGSDVSLVVSRNEDLQDPIHLKVVKRAERAGRTIKMIIPNLQSDTPYYYAIKVDGKIDPNTTGQFKTFPEGPVSFNFAFGNSVKYGRLNQSALLAAIEQDILFFLSTGDLFYANISKNTPDAFRTAYLKAFQLEPLRQLCRKVPLVYIWDDHDYGPNNSDKYSPSRLASRKVYQEIVPHYPLILGQGDVPIYQAFTVGRVRFILTDLRSERSSNNALDGPNKTMMGKKQLEWFMKELKESSRAYALVIWVSSVTWTARVEEGADHWGGFAYERKMIANFIKKHRIHNLLVVSGDAHSVAADDGRNSDYADGGGAPLPVIIAAPLDNDHTSVKGGPYSEGVYRPKKGENCYGLVTIRDEGSKVLLTFSGRNQEQKERILLVHSVEVSPPGALEGDRNSQGAEK